MVSFIIRMIGFVLVIGAAVYFNKGDPRFWFFAEGAAFALILGALEGIREAVISTKGSSGGQ